MSKEFLVKVKHKMEMHRRWKQDVHPWKNIRILAGSVGMRSGKLRNKCSCS